MTTQRWEQIGAAGGIVFVVLQLVGQSLIQVGGAEPPFDAPADEITAFFLNRNPQLFVLGGFLSALSFIAFIAFVGALWARLQRHEAEPAWLALTTLAFGMVAIAAPLSGGGGWELAMLRIEEGLEAETLRLLFDQANFAFASFWVPLAGMLLTSAVVTLRDGALPRWLGWFGAVVAVALLAARMVWAAESGLKFLPYVLFWIWSIAVSVALIRRVGRAANDVPDTSKADD